MSAALLFLSAWRWWLIGCIAAVLSVVIGVQRIEIADLRTTLEHAGLLLGEERRLRVVDHEVASEAALKQTAEYRAKEQAWAQAQQEITRDAETKIAAARADASTAAAATGRLSKRLAALASASRLTPEGAPAPAECAPAIAAGDLQRGLLERLGEAARQLAEFGDASRIAGNVCTAAYESVSGSANE